MSNNGNSCGQCGDTPDKPIRGRCGYCGSAYYWTTSPPEEWEADKLPRIPTADLERSIRTLENGLRELRGEE